MQINSLAILLKDVRVVEREREHRPSLPATITTAKPQKTKVVGNPTREPVNRQSALLLRPERCWASQPLPPAKLPNPFQPQMDALRAELKTERNEHALTRDHLGQCRAETRKLKADVQALQREIEKMRRESKEKDSIIRQLEDVRL